MEEISLKLVGKVLEQDIVSDQDVLLLKKGKILTEANILLLQKHRYKKIKVSEDLSFKKLYSQFLEKLEQLMNSIEEGKELDLQKWFEQEERIARKVHHDVSVISQMYELNAEPTLYRHSTHVGLIAFYLGKLLRFSYKNKLLLWEMGVLHDIGKLKLDQQLRNKHEGELTGKDLRQYKKHPELGWAILNELKKMNVMMLNSSRYHHEKLDGSGFPKGIKVKYISVMVQIVSVANFIDNEFSRHGNLFTLVNKLVEETKNNKLSPAIITPFIRSFMRNQVGKKVLLSNALVGEIVFIFDNEPSQPLLYIVDTDKFIDLRKHIKIKIIEFV